MVNIKVIKNNKFQTAQLGCFFKMPATIENIGLASLLAYFQSNVSKNYQNIAAQENLLRQNYDLDYSVRKQLVGNQVILRYTMNFVEPDLINDENYHYPNIINIFKQLVLEPLFETSGENFFELTKNEILGDMDDILDNPRNLAYAEFNQIYYRDRPQYQDIFGGNKKFIEHATYSDLEGYFMNMLGMPASLIAVASDTTQVENILNAQFSNDLPGLALDFTQKKLKRDSSNLDFIEQTNAFGSQQAQLIIGYSYNDPVKNRLVGVTFANYLAGGEYSILFEKVRTQMGAAYGINATANNNQNQFVINAGLEKEKAADVITAIDEQINKIAAGKINEIALQKTISDLTRAFLVQEDDENNLVKREFGSQLTGKFYSTAENITKLNAINSHDLIDFANNLTLRERYLMV